MIVHIVLFRPRRDLPQGERKALADAFLAATRAIPSIRRARAGRRITHGRAYEDLMKVDYPYGVVLEFDDAAGLKAYLEHPAHEALGALFFASFENALMYDFDLRDGDEELETLLRT